MFSMFRVPRYTRSVAAKRHGSPAPESVKQQRLDDLDVVKKEICLAVQQYNPKKLRLALMQRTYEPLKFDDDEMKNLMLSLLFPSTPEYMRRWDDVKKCIKLLLKDNRFHTRQFMHHVIADQRQRTKIVALLMHKSINPWGTIFKAIRNGNDRVVQLILDHPAVKVNQLYPFGLKRALHYALAVNLWGGHLVVPVILAHPGVDASLAACVSDGVALNEDHGPMMTAVDIADYAYTVADGFERRRSAARHMQLLLDRDDVDIHTINQVCVYARLWYLT